MNTTTANFLYGNNTGSDLSPFHAEIKASLEATSKLPEELSDLFVAQRTIDNADGSPRYMIVAVEDFCQAPATKRKCGICHCNHESSC